MDFDWSASIIGQDGCVGQMTAINVSVDSKQTVFLGDKGGGGVLPVRVNLRRSPRVFATSGAGGRADLTRRKADIGAGWKVRSGGTFLCRLMVIYVPVMSILPFPDPATERERDEARS